jgi:hypothetical protein
MPGLLKPGLMCPECGEPVLLVFHEWSGAEDKATFEYHHEGDPAKEERGETVVPCRSTMTFAEGLMRNQQESP